MFSLSIKLLPLGINLVFSVKCSGGPLLDSKGNLIGINTAIFTQTGEFYPLSSLAFFNLDDIYVRLFLQ